MAQKNFALSAPFIVFLATIGCSAGGSATDEPSFSGSGSSTGQGGQTGASGDTGSGDVFGGGGGLGFSGGFGVSGSTSGNPDGGLGCRSLSQRPEIARQPADIVWIIDNSGSMQ